VKDTFSAYFEITEHKCNVFEVTVHASPGKGPYQYIWYYMENQINDTVVTVLGGDSFRVTITSESSQCEYEIDTTLTMGNDYCDEGIFENMILRNENPGDPAGFYIDKYDSWNGDTVWSDTTIICDEDIYIPMYTTMRIYNTTLVMRQCSKIVVDRGATLIIDSNSCIGLCHWEGIEVWGETDACPNSNGSQGILIMSNSTITGADIAILLAKTDATDPQGYDPFYLGGRVWVTNSEFYNNYIHIMHEDWNVGGICNCVKDSFEHKIHNNIFGTLADEGHCNRSTYADARIQWVYDSASASNVSLPPDLEKPQSRCFIIDLAPYKGYSFDQVGGATQGCDVSIFTKNNREFHPDFNPNNPPDDYGNATSNNTYNQDCTPCECMTQQPFDEYLK
jgi:hypothetical protein